MKEVLQQTEEKMKKAIQATQRDFASVRTGRASAALLDRISIDYHGTDTPIKSMANISVPDGKTLQIQVYDKASVSMIVKAIQKSDLGLTPNTDGNVIRLNIPALTEERRKEMSKVLAKTAEEGKIAIRNVRRDGTDGLKKKEKASELTEDERKRGEEQIQKLTDRFVKELEELLAVKTKEVMEV